MSKQTLLESSTWGVEAGKLNAMLTEIFNALTTFVKTVNSTAPDSNGNVSVETGGATVDLSAYSTSIQMQTAITNAINGILGGAPTEFNTLGELATGLQTVQAFINSAADNDTFVNTINEILAVFANYPEGTNLATLLADKVSTAQLSAALSGYITSSTFAAYQASITTALAGKVNTNGTDRLITLLEATQIAANTAALANKVDKNGTDRLITQAEALQLAGTPAAIAAASTIIPSPLYVPPKNGKNLFNQYLVKNGYGIGTGTGTPTISGFTNGALTNKILFPANTTFTLSGLTAATGRRLSYFDNTGTIIGTTVSITGTTHTLTSPAGTSYILFTARINGESMGTIQMELGSTATTYDTAEEPITIIFSGTSITNNYISGGTAYITLIKNALQPVYGKLFNSINGGVTNQTSAGMLTNLPALLSANPTAKVVMLETSINDAKLDSAGGLTPAETEANLRAMIALIKAAGMQPILKTCLPINPLGTSTAYPTSGSSTMDQTKRASLNIITRRLSKELNLILSDWDFGFAQRTDAEMLVDFLHPASPLGTQKVADIDIKALISPTY